MGQRPAIALALMVWLAAGAGAEKTPDAWYESGRRAVDEARKVQPLVGRAKNVILFVGDGMGVSTVTAARILDGQRRGQPGEEGLLDFETLPHTALIKTYNTNQQVADSAGTMSAIVTGVKTKAGVISVDGTVTRGDHKSAEGHARPTILELAEASGRSTGIVSTTRVTHATPAACYAHSPERGWEDDSALSPEAKASGFPDIARQLIEFSVGDGLEVVLGGGRRGFLPLGTKDPEDPARMGSRADKRDLTTEWLKRPGAAYVWNKSQFDSVDAAKTDHLLGLFEHSHMQFEHDRSKDMAGEPSLGEMTAKALEVLQKNKKGFFLMVEGGRIDHAHHDTNAFRALTDTIAFAEAVRVAKRMTDRADTLIIVTADHSHVFTMAGYPTRGNPILGNVVSNDRHGRPLAESASDVDGKPYTTVGYTNGPAHVHNETDPLHGDYRQDACTRLDSETHGGEDVPLYADGPQAHLFHGVLEQHVIFHVMRDALGAAP